VSDHILDVVIYSHDGRGLGHASRSIAVGLALRRLHPTLRVLFVSGCRRTETLVAGAGLDWMKLPAYATVVRDGKSKGVPGCANLANPDLARFRGRILEHLFATSAPYLVLVDHAPLGKLGELDGALAQTARRGTEWHLGVRGILGKARDVWSEEAVRGFKERYSGLLWYGESSVLGQEPKKAVEDHFGAKSAETGYVSRAYELERASLIPGGAETIEGTISIPWCSDRTGEFLQALADSLGRHHDETARWKIYVEEDRRWPEVRNALRRLRELPYCECSRLGMEYLAALRASKVAIIYGGYNSISDALWAGTPCLVIVRRMRDGEQADHLEKLVAATRGQFAVMYEDEASPDHIATLLDELRHRDVAECGTRVKVNGSEIAASYLASRMEGTASDG